MAIVIHWSSVRGFGILRSQVHGEVPGNGGLDDKFNKDSWLEFAC